jgi:hypothetical protein
MLRARGETGEIVRKARYPASELVDIGNVETIAADILMPLIDAL